MLVVVERRDAKDERAVVSDLFGLTAENRRTVFDVALSRDETGPMECGLCEGGLADPTVAEKYRTVDT